MRKSDLLKHFEQGLSGKIVKDIFENEAPIIHELAHDVSQLLGILCQVRGVPAVAVFLASLSAGVAGFALTDLTKEEVMEMIGKEYDYIKKRRAEWVEKTKKEVAEGHDEDMDNLPEFKDQQTIKVVADPADIPLVSGKDAIEHLKTKQGGMPIILAPSSGKVH